MRKLSKGKKGFTLVIILLGLSLMSILGLVIIGVTTSNFKMAKLDSRSQSAYYIAEAGINYMIDEINTEVNKGEMIGEELFQYIENRAMTLDGDFFEGNNGEEPKAFINVSQVGINEEIRSYEIQSIGEIGDSKRTVNSVIGIVCETTQKKGHFGDVFIYSPKFTFKGSAIKGEGGTIVSGGLMTDDLNRGALLDVTNIYFGGPVTMDGGSTSFGNVNKPGGIYIDGNLTFLNGSRNVYGDIHVNGNAVLKDVILHGNMYVNGNLKFIANGPTLNEKIFYTGNIDVPSNYQQEILSKCTKVESVDPFTIPSFDIEMKDLSWYSQNDYKIRGNVSEDIIPDNAKLVVDNFYSKHYTSPNGNIVIISEKDIDISGWRNISGVLIALNGEVKLNVGSFTGVIISKKGTTASGGGWDINNLKLSDFFTESTMPIDIYEGNGSSSGNVGSGEMKLEVIIPTREN